MAKNKARVQANKLLESKGEKWTAPRESVFRALSLQDRPVSAYQLIELINRDGGQAIKPPSVYRALAFLQETGLAVKVEGLNAFMMCRHGEHDHDHALHHVFLICDACGHTDEQCNGKLSQELIRNATAQGFKPTRQIVELHGKCAACQKA
jgi:Fur family zinc uptake transcriptional regulator